MRFILCFILVSFVFGLKAQKIYDPEAEKLLKAVSEQISSSKEISAKFTFGLDYFEQEEDVQNGVLVQQNDKYIITLGETDVISTEEGFYLVDKESSNVQINDPLDPEMTDLYNPISLMQKYDSGEFEYAIVGEEKVEGNRLILIEFKPTDRYSELSKIRVGLDQTDQMPVYVKIFNKDASRVNIDIIELDLIDHITKVVKFDKSSYPSFEIEDLRID